MAFTNAWSVVLPDDGDSACSGAEQIRDLCTNIEERMNPVLPNRAASGWGSTGHTAGIVTYLTTSMADIAADSYCPCVFSATQSTDFLFTGTFRAQNPTGAQWTATFQLELDGVLVGDADGIVIEDGEYQHVIIRRVSQGVIPGSHTVTLLFGAGTAVALALLGVVVTAQPFLVDTVI